MLMQEQKDRAKADAKSKKAGAQASEVYKDLRAAGRRRSPATPSCRPSRRSAASSGTATLVEAAEEGSVVEVVLEQTPFYAESGGQDSDAGTITGDGVSLEVVDVQRPVKGLIVHRVRVAAGRAADRGGRAGRGGRRMAARCLPGPLGHPRDACGAAPGAGPDRAAERLVQQAGLPAAGLRLAGRAEPAGALRRRGGGQPGHPLRPERQSRPTCRWPPRGRSVPWPCSARPTARRSGWSRWAGRGPASCAAAPTCSTPRRSGWSPLTGESSVGAGRPPGRGVRRDRGVPLPGQGARPGDGPDATCSRSSRTS